MACSRDCVGPLGGVAFDRDAPARTVQRLGIDRHDAGHRDAAGAPGRAGGLRDGDLGPRSSGRCARDPPDTRSRPATDEPVEADEADAGAEDAPPARLPGHQPCVRPDPNQRCCRWSPSPVGSISTVCRAATVSESAVVDRDGRGLVGGGTSGPPADDLTRHRSLHGRPCWRPTASIPRPGRRPS